MTGAGFVLTGGDSSRMGLDKALLPFRGTTLVQWIARQALEAAGEVYLVGAPERYAQLGIRCLPERFPGLGPLSGIEAALREGAAEWSLILACDLPGAGADTLQRLFQSALSSQADAVAATGASGRLQPLFAVYNARVLPAVQTAIRAGRLSVQELLRHLKVDRFPVDSEMLLENVNTPQDWARWTATADPR